MNLEQIAASVNAAKTISQEEALYVLTAAPLEELGKLTHQVTLKYASLKFDLCSICNVKSGRCTEDCQWCAQSCRHHCAIDIYDVLSDKECLSQAKAQEEYGVGRFALVASGRRPSAGQLKRCLEIYKTLKNEQGMSLCASLGLVDGTMLAALKEAGVTRIHCNLESSREFFPKVCTTHTFEDKVQVIKKAQALGLEVCSGGILGMGESLEDRVSLAFSLRDLGITSIPLNVLHPIKGTRLESRPVLSEEDFLRAAAMFRLVLPKAYLRFAGGRAQYSAEFTQKALYFGINSSIVGNLLTTQGREIVNDLKLFKEAGYEL